MKNNLKTLRLNANLTQEQLAELIGTKKQYVSSLETGARNISKIRADTMERICSVLNCDSKDLFVTTHFEFNNDGKMIIDGLYYDKRMINNYIIDIGGEYFIAPNNVIYKNRKHEETLSDMLKPMFGRLEDNAMELDDYMYVFLDCVPRRGFDVKLGRAITEQEFGELRERFNLDESNTTSEFETSKGGFYGKSAEKYFTAVQIKISAEEAFSLQRELNEKGIEASNGSPEKVTIRVK